MMRTSLKSDSYFAKFISFQTASIEEFKQHYEDHKEKWHDKTIRSNFFTIYTFSLHKLVAQYSAGDSISEITKSYLESIDFLEKGWKKESGYVQMLWMLSIGTLLKIDKVDYCRLLTLVDNQYLHDYLIDYISTFSDKDRTINSSLEFDRPYKGIVDATKMDKERAQARIKKYLEKEWYKGHRDSYWYDDHKSEFDIYFGYWSFESAAITVIMDLDDSSYRENQYYPRDLVAYFLGNSGTVQG